MNATQTSEIRPKEQSTILNCFYAVYSVSVGRIIAIAKAIFSGISTVISACVGFCRRFVVIDFAIAITMKGVNGIVFKVFHRKLFGDETEKSLMQRNAEQELALIKNKVGINSIYSQFSSNSTLYLDEVLPKYIGQRLSGIPSSAIDKKSYKELVYMRCRTWTTQFAHVILGKNALSTVVNMEAIFLKSMLWGIEVQKNVNARQRMTIMLLRTLANSLSNESKIQQYLAQFSFRSHEEQMIARLKWHKDNHCLPKGLPDPDQVRLLPHNLNEKLEDALYDVIKRTVEGLHDRYLPQLNQGVLGKLYSATGKTKLISMITYCIAEYGFYQLADPHRLGMAVLSSYGIDVADYDLYGFGAKRKIAILNLGQKMMGEASRNNASWTSVISLYEKSGLKHNAGSMEEIRQRNELKVRLKDHISSIFYDIIKEGDQFKHDSYLKGIREKLSELPILGVSTIGLHALISGTVYSLGYLTRGKQDQQKSFVVWLFKHFSGKKLCEFLGDRIVELIYHPHLMITLTEMLVKASDFLLDQEKSARDNETFTIEEFRKITKFIFTHFTQDNQNLTRHAAVLLEYLTSDDGFQSFANYLKPTNMDFLEMSLESLLPSIKECWLYNKIINGFRKESVIFEGDAKFWEMFTKEYLNQRVERLIAQKFVSGKGPSLAEESHIRTQIIDELNELEWTELRKVMSQAFQPLIVQVAQPAPASSQNTAPPVVQAGNLNRIAIQWDYVPKQ